MVLGHRRLGRVQCDDRGRRRQDRAGRPADGAGLRHGRVRKLHRHLQRVSVGRTRPGGAGLADGGARRAGLADGGAGPGDPGPGRHRARRLQGRLRESHRQRLPGRARGREQHRLCPDDRRLHPDRRVLGDGLGRRPGLCRSRGGCLLVSGQRDLRDGLRDVPDRGRRLYRKLYGRHPCQPDRHCDGAHDRRLHAGRREQLQCAGGRVGQCVSGIRDLHLPREPDDGDGLRDVPDRGRRLSRQLHREYPGEPDCHCVGTTD